MSETTSNLAPAAKPGFVSGLDLELENSWRERRWGAFVRAWLTAVVTTAVAGFVFPLVMIGIYTLIAMIIFRAEGRGAPPLLTVCASIAGLAGLVALIFTAPMTALKVSQDQPRR